MTTTVLLVGAGRRRCSSGAPADGHRGRRPGAGRRAAQAARRSRGGGDGRAGRGARVGLRTARSRKACPRSRARSRPGPSSRSRPCVVEAGVPFASSGDDENDLMGLRSLTEPARRSGIAIIAGCGLAPGLADVLARHAADAFDEVDEIGIARARAPRATCASRPQAARSGVAPPSCATASTTSRAAGGAATSWSGSPSRSVRAECERVATGRAPPQRGRSRRDADQRAPRSRRDRRPAALVADA